MPVFAPCYGFGARHVQIILIVLMLTKDQMGCELAMELLLKQKGVYIFSAAQDDNFARTVRNYPAAFIRSIETCTIVMGGISMILGGYLALKLNNKYLLLISSILQAVACASMPPMTMHLGKYGFAATSLFYHFTRDCHKSVSFNIMAKWVPQREISRAFSYYTFAPALGSFISKSALPLFINEGSYGVFILCGAIQFLWCAVYFIVGTQDPRTCFYLSDREGEHLGKHLGDRRKISMNGKIPWKDILKTPIMYSFIISYCGWVWERQMVKRCIDMSELMPRDVLAQGTLTALLIYVPLGYMAGLISDKLLSKQIVELSNIRKIYHSISCWGAAVCSLFIGYCTDISSVNVFITLNLLFSYIMPIGFNDAIFDLSPNYATLLFSIASSAGNLSLACEPVVSAVITSRSSATDKKPWNWLSYMSALIMYLTNYVFLMAGTIGLKKFDSVGAVDCAYLVELCRLARTSRTFMTIFTSGGGDNQGVPNMATIMMFLTLLLTLLWYLLFINRFF